ncbi:Aldo-keto reductase [Cladobotryum mycophilum]|uniref:Aldo-keto reductase n=1 Tax=Cladobotryum mycophilum TaxID=491253 RepID=A0ABR0S827_9HYPO
MAPKLIFGTASLGMDLTEFQDEESVKNLLKTLNDLHIHHLDTAARYPPLNQGRAEQLLGLTKELSSGFVIDTKVFTDTKTDASGDLSGASVQKSVASSLERMQRDGVNILYAHRPDPATPLEEQVEAMNDQITHGHCKAWGVSNFSPALLEEVLKICEQKGLRKPCCYQGQYSILTRAMGTKLLPLLRAHGIAYYGFRVVEAGFLSGRFVNNEYANTWLDEKNPLGKLTQGLYASKVLQAATKRFDADVKALGLLPTEVAIRWAVHHSALGDEDGIILGASKTAQVVEMAGFVQKGPLPDNVLNIVQEAWSTLKESRANVI